MASSEIYKFPGEKLRLCSHPPKSDGLIVKQAATISLFIDLNVGAGRFKAIK